MSVCFGNMVLARFLFRTGGVASFLKWSRAFLKWGPPFPMKPAAEMQRKEVRRTIWNLLQSAANIPTKQPANQPTNRLDSQAANQSTTRQSSTIARTLAHHPGCPLHDSARFDRTLGGGQAATPLVGDKPPHHGWGTSRHTPTRPSHSPQPLTPGTSLPPRRSAGGHRRLCRCGTPRNAGGNGGALRASEPPAGSV